MYISQRVVIDIVRSSKNAFSSFSRCAGFFKVSISASVILELADSYAKCGPVGNN